MLHQEKEFPNDSGRPLSYYILPIKGKMAASKQSFFSSSSSFAFSIIRIFTYHHSKSGVLQMTINFASV